MSDEHGSVVRWVTMFRVALLAALSLALPAAVNGENGALGLEHRTWLEEVDPLISKQERREFLKLEKDYQRDAFIERFWEVRDPFPDTRVNEFRELYYSRLEDVYEEWGGLEDDRARMFVLNGEPSEKLETDCGFLTWPMEVWTYAYSARLSRPVHAIFYQRNSGGPFRLWNPAEGHAVLLMTINEEEHPEDQRNVFHSVVLEYCAEFWDDALAMLETFTIVEREMGASSAQAASSPRSLDPEWLGGFRAFSTDVPQDAPTLSAELEVAFVGRHQSRTRVAGTFLVPRTAATLAGEGEAASYNFQLTGEVLRDGALFESFRYRFDLPLQRLRADELSLQFERLLRPAAYSLVLKLEDLNGGTVLRREEPLEVPAVVATASADAAAGEEETPDEEPSVALGVPSEDVLSGATRFVAAVEGEAVKKVRFLLDGIEVLTKTRPPYSVELDLGGVPRSHTVRAVAIGADGSELATDELLLNPGKQNFVVRLVEPRDGADVERSVRVRAQASVPEGKRLDRLELFVGEQRVATLYQEPFVQSVNLDPGELQYLRAIGHLEDGSQSEDLVVVNSGQFGATVDVRLVELYAAVLDGNGSPVEGLQASDFSVVEAGSEQELFRFEFLRDLPLFAGLLIDTSGSMAEHFETVHRMGSAFLESTIGPRDRAAVITFSEQPRLASAFTADHPTLSSALAGLRAEQGTALWDSVVYAIDYFGGVKAQRAVVLLSDGDDRRSQHTFDEALRFAQSSGVTVYTVGLDQQVTRQGRRLLARLAEGTGGRSYFLGDLNGLGDVYDEIERELRSRYLLAYRSSSEGAGFRPIEIQVADRDLEIRALKGYFP